MPISEKQRDARDKWDAENMAYQTVKVRKTLLEDFRATCVANGDKVNSVLREAMENYVAATPSTNGEEMTMAEMTRFIIGLRDAGWSEEKINNFILFIESGDERYKPKPDKAQEESK